MVRAGGAHCKRLGAQEPQRGQIAFAHLSNWSEEVGLAFVAAFPPGDNTQVDTLVEEQTGVRPTRTGWAVGLVVDRLPAPLDPAAAITEAKQILAKYGEHFPYLRTLDECSEGDL